MVPFLSLIGKPISKNLAEKIAKDFIDKRRSYPAPLAYLPQMRQTPGMAEANGENEPFYIFNVGNKQGFVIVSGDDAAKPVLGYSDSGEIDMDDVPENMAEWLKLNELYVKNRAKNAAVKQEEHIYSGNGTVVVAPLLGEICWGQDYPFNEKCPTYTAGGQETHYYSGCVVTAATQIMGYYKYPQRGTGTKSYTFKDETLTADFGNTVYDWDNMLPYYPGEGVSQEQVSAAATLAYHFGIAVEMIYAEEGSGTYTMLVPGALRDHFGYDTATTMRKRNYYSSSEWLYLIKEELDAGRPVYYGATSDDSNGGHAFVCDGYDSEGFVHINWGWYGKSNGYFLVNHMNPSDLGEGGGTGGYNTDQEIITGIQPSTGSTAEFCRPLYGYVRLACTDYGSEFSLMTHISNYDIMPFDGQLAAVITRGGDVLKVLKTDGSSTHIDGFNKGQTGFYNFSMRDITKNAGTDVTDGKCEVRLAFRESSSSPWQIIRHELGTAGYISANIAGGMLTLYPEDKPHPDVALLNPIAPDGEVHAKGSALFNVTLKNNASDFRLKNIVIQFRSKSHPEQKWDYENKVNIYDGSTETAELLVNLDEDMPEGEYDIILYEKDYEEYPFKQATAETAKVTVLPASEIPLMRISRAVEWQNVSGETEINQGDYLYLTLNARNYGAAGKARIITWLENVDNPEQRYMFLQNDIEVKRGESVAVPFYRKLPVDPGVYNIKITYLTDDGNETDDANQGRYDHKITVGKNTYDIMLNAVSIDMPDKMSTEEKIPCSITLMSPNGFSGTVYVRLRQYNLRNGEIATMNTLKMNAGETKQINFNYKPSVVPEHYIVLVEAKQNGAEGTIGSYANCYKLITVTDDTSGISSAKTVNNGDDIVNILYKDGKIFIDNVSGSDIKKADIININGSIIRSYNKNELTSMCLESCAKKGIFLIRIITDNGTVTKKITVNE